MQEEQGGLDRMEQGGKQKNHSLFAGYAALGVVAVLIIAKAIAYIMSDSASILSSLTDSVMDSFVSLTAVMSLHYAARPADEDHRWGHGKMEAVSAMFQSAVIAAGGAFLVFESFDRFMKPVEISYHGLGIAVMVLSIILSAALVRVQRAALKKKDSLAIEADSAHYGSDIIVNIGVIIVLLAQKMGAPLWIDPVFTLGVAGFMAYLAKEIGGKAVNMLMDRELPDDERLSIIKIIEAHGNVLGWHDLRTHRNGETRVISFDMEADGDLSLRVAHQIAKDIEGEILKIFPLSEILIHIDPAGDTDDARHRVKGVHH